MGHRVSSDSEARPVRSRCVPSDQYIHQQYRVHRRRQVLRASHPNISLVPKQYFFMETSRIWLVPRGLVNNKPRPSIELQALWSPDYSEQNVIHESAVQNISCQKSDIVKIGSLTVTSCVRLDWTNSDHPDTGWITHTNLFYVTKQTLPDGVKVIIASKGGNQNTGAKISNMAAPAHTAVLKPKAKQEQAQIDAAARAQREQDRKDDAAKALLEYQREQQELQKESQQGRRRRPKAAV